MKYGFASDNQMISTTLELKYPNISYEWNGETVKVSATDFLKTP